MERLRRAVEKKGVELIDEHRIVLRCKACGQVWSPNLLRGGRLPRGYWKCPNGCNSVCNEG